MRKLMNRLRSRAGESFAEVLVALLIVALAALLLAGMYSASSALDKNAMESDKKLYEAVTKLETTTEPGTTGHVTISGEAPTASDPTIPIEIYTEDGLTAYQGR